MVLRDVQAHRLLKEDVCDADAILIAAARFHGTLVNRPCPMCGKKKIHEVQWIHSEHLGKRSGTARDSEEIAHIAANAPEGAIDVHVVEVCLACRWNFLLTTATAVVS